MRCLNAFKMDKNWGLGWKTFLSLKGRHATLSILCYNLHDFSFLVRSSGLRRNFGCELFACLLEIVAFVAFEQVTLFLLNVSMLLGRGCQFLRGLSQKQFCFVVMALSLSSLSPAEQRQSELVPGCPWGILSSGYWPHSLLLHMQTENEGDCLLPPRTGDRKYIWKCHVKTIEIPCFLLPNVDVCKQRTCFCCCLASEVLLSQL